MLFFCVKNLLLNIISNNAPILKDKNSILLKEVMEVLYNILTHVYLFPPTQQPETDYEIAAIYGNLWQFAVLYYILLNSTKFY